MKKALTSVIILLGIGTGAFAGEKSTNEKRGDKYFFVYSFDKAIRSYTQAKQLSVEGQRRLAESYGNLDSNSQSETAYAKLVSTAGGNLADDYFNYAMVLKINGKYEESAIVMDKILELYPADLRARDYAANKDRFAGWLEESGKFRTERLEMNSGADDFGTSYYKKHIVFCSTGANPKPAEKRYNWNGKPFLDMYISEVKGEQLEAARLFDEGLNRGMHDGPASFSKDGTYMAFTRNNYDLKRGNRVVNIEIHFSRFSKEAWSDPESFVLNSEDYSVGHPCLTADGNTMYFSSDMPGGFGGADIYRVTRDTSGAWGKAENLGVGINTEGDELFPFYQERHNMLLFASDGRFGLGGLDIFIAEWGVAGLGRVYNAGAPLNSPYDDFAMITNDIMTEGYFSSDRIGGRGGDDIYAVDIYLELSRKLEGFARDEDGMIVPGTYISLFDGDANIISTLTTGEDGAYSFPVSSDNHYRLTGNKEHYLEGYVLANTLGGTLIVRADVTLIKKEEEITLGREELGADLALLLDLKNIYYDLDKFDMRADAEIELRKIVKIMNANPAMIVELSAHTDCRATREYNQILSDKRAEMPVRYIKARITNPERIYGRGYGETRLLNGCACEDGIITNCSDEEYQMDRRTEFIIISNSREVDSGIVISKEGMLAK